MVEAVRSGMSQQATARQFGVSVSTVAFWVDRARGRRLDRVDWANRKPGRAWNRTRASVERRILALRTKLRDDILGECGAAAIQRSLKASRADAPSLATINRVLARHGAQDRARRVRRPAPPKGWYLPAVAAASAELDCFDLIEDLKIAQGPLVLVLTGTSLHGGLPDAWPLSPARAQTVVKCLTARWHRDGLPAYAQFDNDTIFQGAHQHPDSIGRVTRLCLALGVTPVFAPPREHGFQNPIEGFNALWQSKLWQRHRFADLKDLKRASARYIRAHRLRNGHRQERAPARRRFPRAFRLDLNAPLLGTVLYLRRSDERGRVHLLGRSFEVSANWPHRLVRCEVDLSAHRIRFYALRRKEPTVQPLLATVPYHRPQRCFQGAP
jgi:transposase-like protein